MKLTKREKILLLSLGVLILIVGYYKFILAPQLVRIKELKAEVEDYSKKAQKAKIAVSPNNKIHKDFKIMNSKIIYGSQRLFPRIIQEKYITIIDEMAEKANIKVSSIGFTNEEINRIETRKMEDGNQMYHLKQLVEEYHGEFNVSSNSEKDSGEKSNENKENSNSSEEDLKTQLETMTATINFEGKYENIIAFIKSVEALDKKIIVKNLSLSNPEEGPMVGNILLDFYAVRKLKPSDQDESYLKWDIEDEYGRENPFNPFSGYVGTDNNDSKTASRERYDFIMTVKPITSDLPTIIIGKTKDTAMRSYVYADNPSFEDVEFQILQEGDKYYYKYKTKSDSYPEDYDGNRVEFKPNGKELKLNIISHERNSKDDNSGVNMALINKSNLRLSVKIDYDDSKKSRVNILKKIGNISVKR
ncbi:hypothetical protein R9X47_03075 [Wukongibacter baidiensis]|uniref:hypothetical protein n=1 Tax=Wukongibacter baidiensis TaxID=1723361 RepID=UPI003D7F3873